MTARVHVSIDLPAPQEDVWADVSDLASHTEWMSDADTITFVGPQRSGVGPQRSGVGPQRSGVGTVFDCVTKVGPIRLTDRMTVTAWDAPWRIAIRHVLNDFLLDVGGHIGYDVRPTRRREGHATAMLRAALPWALDLGIDPALVTCDDDNVGSIRVIEACGGVLEDVRGVKRRYWVPTT